MVIYILLMVILHVLSGNHVLATWDDGGWLWVTLECQLSRPLLTYSSLVSNPGGQLNSGKSCEGGEPYFVSALHWLHQFRWYQLHVSYVICVNFSYLSLMHLSLDLACPYIHINMCKNLECENWMDAVVLWDKICCSSTWKKIKDWF